MLQTLELTMPELLARYKSGEIPDDAHVQVTFDDKGDRNSPPADPLLELLNSWEKEDSTLTPEQQAESERVSAAIEEHGVKRIKI